MRMVATGRLPQRLPGLDRNLAIRLRGEIENDFGGIDIGFDARAALRRPAVIDLVVQLGEAADLCLGIPADALAAVAELVGERSEGRKAAIGVWIIALDDRDLRRRH